MPSQAIKRDFQVNNNADDAEENASSGAVNLTSSDLELISDSGTGQIVGIRFRDVSVPQGTTILSAILEFETDETDSGSTSLTIEGEDTDDAAIFTTSNSDISDRTTTTASVAWSPGAWNTTNERHQSPDISTIVQEIVDRVGWSSGNSMVFIFSGSGERTAESHNGEESAAPILRLEWAGQESIPGGEVCYGVADSNDHFVLIDTDDGTVDTDVGDTGASSVEAITLDPDDFAVYGADRDRLGRINVDTGELIHLSEDFGTGGGSAGAITFDDVDSLAFDPMTGTLWAVDARGGSDALFQVDIDTGAHVEDVFGSGTDYVLISGTGIGTSIDDIAIDPDDGTMYASDTTNSQLITINTTTGAGTAVGSFGGTLDMEGLGFRFDGVLYGTVGQRIYSVNTSTGAATQVGSGDTLTAGDDYESFECHFTATSRAVIAELERVHLRDGDGVRWRTTAEDGTLGFYVYRRGPQDREWQRIGDVWPALAGAPQGGTYWLADPKAGEAAAYLLVEIEAGGRLRNHGPFSGAPTKDIETSNLSFGAEGFFAEAHPRQPRRRADPGAPSARSLEKARTTRRRAPSAKIYVTESGMQRVGLGDLAPVMDVDAGRLRDLLERGGLRLEHAGESVAWIQSTDGEALVFYGEEMADLEEGAPSLFDPFVGENVYRLSLGPGLRMERVVEPAIRPETIPHQLFSASLKEEVDVFAGIAASPDPDGDYWFWHALSAGTPGFDSRVLEIDLPGFEGSGSLGPEENQVRIQVELFGASDAGPHRLALEVDGYWGGEEVFVGRGSHHLEFTFPTEAFTGEGHELRLISILDPATAYSFLYVDSVRITYPRTFKSSNGRSLFFESRRGAPVRIEGFATPDIRVFDIEDSLRPVLLQSPGPFHGPGQGDPGDSFSFALRGLGDEMSGERSCLASSSGAFHRPRVEIWSEPETLLKNRRRRADFLILTPEILRVAAEELADYRRADGLEVEVIGLEQIYNEFGHGLSTPWALHDFLGYATRRWQLAPKYVLLLGRGTFDHRDLLGAGDQLVPPLMARGPGGIYPSQHRFLPEGTELAIGRLPITDESEVRAYLDRLRLFENGLAAGRSLVVADQPAIDADFLGSALDLAPWIAPFSHPEVLQMGDPAALDALHGEIVDGLDWLVFIGHGTSTAWGEEAFWSLADLDRESSRHPIVLAATCLTNRSDLPGFASLGEEMVLSPQAGAIAVLAPSGTTAHHDVSRFFEHFWRTASEAQILAGTGTERLGDRLILAKRSYGQVPGADYLLSLLTLLGDPTLKLPRPTIED